MPGCLFGPTAEDSSSTWKEPGLYSQFEPLQAAPLAGYSFFREAPSAALPFPDGALAALDGAGPSRVSNGQMALTRTWNHDCGCPVIEADHGEQTRAGF